MANMFLGFPVPRAKIADMIAGAAPPKEHAPWHEPDGSDPLILPADIAAGQIIKWDGSKFVGVDEPSGGITLPLDDIYINSKVQAKNCLYQIVTGSGAITEHGDGVYVGTGTTQDSSAELRNLLYPFYPALTWSKKRTVILNVDFGFSAGANDELWLVSGQYGNAKHIGFKVISQVLYGTCYEAAETEVALTGGANPNFFYTYYSLKFVYDGASSVKFYVNSVLRGEITTNIPSGLSYADRPFDLYVKMFEEGYHSDVAISSYTFYQEA